MKLAAVAAAIMLAAVAGTSGLSALILQKTYRVDEERATVYLSYEDHPECGAVLEYVNAEDLEAGDIVSGDPTPCEYRNLIIRVLLVLIVIGAIGTMLGVGWKWFEGRQKQAPAPGSG
jgi:hypothetical protein